MIASSEYVNRRILTGGFPMGKPLTLRLVNRWFSNGKTPHLTAREMWGRNTAPTVRCRSLILVRGVL
jgi:hypothetical protein